MTDLLVFVYRILSSRPLHIYLSHSKLIIFLRNLNPIVIIIIIPIMDLLVYPALRRNGFNFTPIKRITLGFFIAGLAMLYAAILQKFVYEQSPCHDNLPSECVDENGDPNPAPINVWCVSVLHPNQFDSDCLTGSWPVLISWLEWPSKLQLDFFPPSILTNVVEFSHRSSPTNMPSQSRRSV